MSGLFRSNGDGVYCGVDIKPKQRENEPMTVAELIAALQAVEDKDVLVAFNTVGRYEFVRRVLHGFNSGDVVLA